MLLLSFPNFAMVDARRPCAVQMCPLNLAVLAALDASSLQLDLDVRQMLLQVLMWPLGGGMPIESAPFAPHVWQEVANAVEEVLWPTP